MRTARLLLAGAVLAGPLAAAPAPPVRPGTAALVGPPAPAPSVRAPQSFKLDNGLQCILVENHERPLIRMDLVCRWDRTELPAGKEGIGGFLPAVMAVGAAGPNSRLEFLRALDRLGVVYGFRAQMGRYRLEPGGRQPFPGTRHGTAGGRGGAARLRRPHGGGGPGWRPPGAPGPAPSGSGRRPGSCGPSATRHILAPPGPTPFERIELQDLIDFRQRVIRPEASTLAFYGDLNLAQAKQLAFMHLGIWGPAPQPPLKGIPPKPSAGSGPEPHLLALLDSAPARNCGPERPVRPRPEARPWRRCCPSSWPAPPRPSSGTCR